MENVLAAFVTLFLMLSAAFTLSSTFISSQDTIRASWQSMEARISTQARTHLSPVNAYAVGGTANDLEFTYRNDGETKLAEFAHWDVFVQYFDSSDPVGYHIERLAYTANTPGPNQWTVGGIYANTKLGEAETYDPGILNPGEEAVFAVNLSPALGVRKTIQFIPVTPNGISAPTQFTRNDPPNVIVNTGVQVATHGTKSITAAALSTTDPDDEPHDLVYEILEPPSKGTLSLGNTFTQLAINNGKLVYTHTGSGNDSFSFSVTDGMTILGPYTFTITVDSSLILKTNEDLPVDNPGTGVIDKAHLEAIDSSSGPDKLIYTVVTPPTNGTLSLGSTFTQLAINNGMLTYTRTGAGGDSFSFTVSDGTTTIGPYTFTISNP
ncbi:MAG: hypothetical protein IT324_03210 [Anaerolineae bacterium]|nr:hypothetical protein [Anaerolineae bacterium]